jgi:hypothetical protein
MPPVRQLKLQRHGDALTVQDVGLVIGKLQQPESTTSAATAGLGIVRHREVFALVGVSRGVCEIGGGGG